MKAKLTILSMLLFQLLCWNTKAQVLPSDSLALVALANSTGQPSWNISDNWLTGTVDTWHGITVNAGRVTEIDLSFNNLFGSVPPEIGNLDAVTLLNLSGNIFLESIPPEMGSMIALTDLYLSNAGNLVSNFPTEMGNLINLEILNLNGHRLSGQMPAAIASLVNLRQLEIDAIPSNFAGLADPLDVSTLTQLEFLNIAGNRFEDLPDLTTLPNLTQAVVENNYLEFDDLETNLSIATFLYTPQRVPEVDSTVLYLPGDNLQLDALVGGSANSYQWFKDAAPIPGATNPTFDILSATSLDEGSYYCEINSAAVPGLTITSRGFYVAQNPYNTSPQLVSSTFTFNQLTTINEPIFNMSVNMGDINDDGIEDFGFLLRDRLQIFFGGPFHQTPDLEILADPSAEMHEVRAADFTGDGFVDIVLSSSDINDGANTSKLDFYFGSQLLDTNVDHVIQASDILPVSELTNLIGINFNRVGDVNNDGTQDFVVNLNDDELYLYFGGNTLSTTPDQTLTGYNSDFGIPDLNPTVFDIANRISPLGDINGDGIDDFAVSDFFRGFQSSAGLGLVVIHFGKAAGQIQPDLGIALSDPQYSEVRFFGINIEVGKINNDGFNDILISAGRSEDNSIPGNNGSDMIFVYHGGPALDNIADLAQTVPAPPFELDNTIHVSSYIADILAIPDVTNDGKEEFYFGSWGGLTNAYIVESEDFGTLSNTPTKILEAPDKDFSLGVNNNNIFFQRESAVGDFNNDGILDIMQPQPFDPLNFVYVYPVGPVSATAVVGQPQDVLVCENDIAQFGVVVSGSSPTYQWQESTDGIVFTDLSDGGIYSNVTTDSLTIDPTSNSMDGYMYRCVVSGSIISDAATLSVGLGNYVIPSMDVACSSPTFFVPIEAASTVSSEVLGLDFCLQYDTAMMIPTGNAVVRDVVHGGNTSYADYFLNTDSSGLINGVIFLTSAAPFPTYFSGSGTVIEIEFTQGNSFVPGAQTEVSLCGVTESTLISGNIDHCAQSATYSSINDPSFIGTIKFWDKNGKRLTYDTLNPGAFIPTTIIGADSTCSPLGSTTFLPDLNGEFTYQVSEGDHIQIERDIPGDFSGAGPCTNVMSWINGADQNRTMKIATLDPSFTPNAYQIVAADVNMDGVVNAGDVTLMAARSVMSICGFPSATIEKDWLFIDQTTFDTDPSFLISANYPLDDGTGYSKNHVPSIPDCLSAPLDTMNSCVATMQEDYIAILLGDVSGNWKSVDGANLRTSEPQLTFQFDQLIEQGEHYLVPVVFANPEDVESFDLMFAFDEEHISIEELVMPADGFIRASNIRDNQFLFTSFSLDAVSSNNVDMYLKFKTDDVKMATDYIDQIAAFVNGEEVTTGTTLVLGTSDLIGDWKVYPNPFTEDITLEYGSEINAFDLRITNAAGQQVYAKENLTGQNGKVSLDLSNLSSGIYFLRIKSEDEVQTIRIVK